MAAIEAVAAGSFPASSKQTGDLRSHLAEAYDAVRALTERLSAPLAPEDQVVQTMPDVSPTKWHRAHTTWFFETFLLVPNRPGYRPLDEAYAYLFNSYYEQVGAQYPRPQRGLLSRPTCAEIADYRRWVDEAMRELIATADDGKLEALAPLIELGLHHEQQHQELLATDIKHVMGHNPLAPAAYPAAGAPKPLTAAAPLDWVPFEGGIREIGHGNGMDGFAFDHEGPRHEVLIRPFALASRPVTNGEYLAFMADGGYERPELWLSDGWAAVQAGNWRAPLYWRAAEGANRDGCGDGGGDGWTEFTLHGLKPLDPNQPVCHVSHYEADAFATWAGKRLPTEAELELAAQTVAIGGRFMTGPDSLQPQPAPAERAPGALQQIYGDVWEWSQSAYMPYPGYRPPAGAVGEYNGKFMSGQMVLRGGSCATPAGHMRATYRNFFPPAARWQFTGIRLATDR